MDLNFTAPINRTGYGVAALGLLRGWNNIGNTSSLFPIHDPLRDTETQYHQFLQQQMENAKFFNPKSPSLRIWHQDNMAQHAGGVRIGLPIFELNSFTAVELHNLYSLDEIFVCSKWAQEVLEDHNLNSQIVPLGVDREVFNPTPQIEHSTTTFLNIGKWEIRKGHDILIDAFTSTFTEDDDVQLIMCCSNPFLTPEQTKTWHDRVTSTSIGQRKIKLVQRLGTQFEVAQLMNHADCGVFPARAEGWNLELLEMMACGKHVITTNYSGHRQFVTTDNSYLIQPEDLEPAHDDKWFHGQGEWMKFTKDNFEHLCMHMDSIHKKKQGGVLGINQEGIETAKKYSWENAAIELQKKLRLC